MGRRYEPDINYNLEFFSTLNRYITKGSNLLDLGTGAGKVIYEGKLYKVCKEIVGLDINLNFIAQAKLKARAPEFGNIRFFIADVLKKLKFGESKFDVVTAMFAPFNINEVHRVLKPRGIFIAIFALLGDHKEMVRLLPEKFVTYFGKALFSIFKNKGKPNKFKVEEKRVLKYKWIFSDVQSVNEFYSKILEKDVSKFVERLHKTKSGEIPITRKIGIVVLRKQ